MSAPVAVLFRFSSLGDVVLSSAFVEGLHLAEPSTRIVLVTQEAFKDFVESQFPAPVQIWALPRRLSAWRAFVEGSRLARFLRDLHPDADFTAFDLHSVSKSFFFFWGFRAQEMWEGRRLKLLRVQKKGLLRRLSVLRGQDLLGPRWVFSEALKCLPHSAAQARPRLRATRNPAAFSILLAPDSQHWKKRWPETHWKELLAILQQWQGPRLEITLVGGASALSAETLETASQGPHPLRNLLGKTRLEALAGIAAQHQVAVCGNSAWLHIAEAVGTPVVALAGPIVPGFGFSPWLPESVELSVSLPCRPCTLHGDGACHLRGDRHHACMRDISAAQVFQALKERLRGLA